MKMVDEGEKMVTSINEEEEKERQNKSEED